MTFHDIVNEISHLAPVRILSSTSKADISKVKLWANRPESEKDITLIMVIGITDFDKTTGLVGDSEKTNVDAVRANVQYSMLARLYNEVIEAKMTEERFALTDVNAERVMELAKNYLEYEDKGPGGNAE